MATGDLAYASWLNDLYIALTTTMQDRGITTGITAPAQKEIGDQILASDQQALVNNIASLKTKEYTRHADWTYQPTTVAVGDLIKQGTVSETSSKQAIDDMVDQLKNLFGNKTTGDNNTFLGGTTNGNTFRTSGCTDKGNNYYPPTGCTDKGNSFNFVSSGNENTGNYVCSERNTGRSNVGNFVCSQTSTGNSRTTNNGNSTSSNRISCTQKSHQATFNCLFPPCRNIFIKNIDLRAFSNSNRVYQGVFTANCSTFNKTVTGHHQWAGFSQEGQRSFSQQFTGFATENNLSFSQSFSGNTTQSNESFRGSGCTDKGNTFSRATGCTDKGNTFTASGCTDTIPNTNNARFIRFDFGVIGESSPIINGNYAQQGT